VGTGQKYTTIQSAINAAKNGDIVKVNPGTYTENINFNGKAITVTGTKPTTPATVKKTIINGNRNGAVVTFESKEGAGSVLEGFTITNGSGYAESPGDTYGGGVYCSGASPTLTDNVITGNRVNQSGGGVCCGDCSPTLTGNTISGNTADANGGGVACYPAAAVLTNNVITGNAADQGGGVFCFSSAPILTNNVISGNTASSEGGGVFCGSCSPTLANNTISGNSGSGGGGVCCSDSSAILKNNIIALSTKGGGLYCDDRWGVSKPVITYSNVWDNVGGNYVNWPNQTGKNGNISKNPLFVDAAGGNFHLQSTGGHWTAEGFVDDTVTSPCIGVGDPATPIGNQPTPNDGRVEMGAYGGTSEASKDPPGTSGVAAVTAAAVATTGGSAQIVVTLASAASVQATILNVAGREVAVLPEQDLPQGISNIPWDGRSTLGTKVPTGRYLVRVTARRSDGSQAQAIAVLSLSR
jgi:parallel beta-helix repeat protein